MRQWDGAQDPGPVLAAQGHRTTGRGLRTILAGCRHAWSRWKGRQAPATSAGAAFWGAVHSFCSEAAACLLVVNVESLVSYKRRLNDHPPLSKLNLAAVKFRVSHTISAPENCLWRSRVPRKV